MRHTNSELEVFQPNIKILKLEQRDTKNHPYHISQILPTLSPANVIMIMKCLPSIPVCSGLLAWRTNATTSVQIGLKMQVYDMSHHCLFIMNTFY